MQIIQANAGDEIEIPGEAEKHTMVEGQALSKGSRIWVTPTMYRALLAHPDVIKKREYQAHDAPLNRM